MVSTQLIQPQLLNRRQWTGGVWTGTNDYGIKARLLGLTPTMPNDLIASMLFAIIFLGITAGCGFVARDKKYRTFSLYTLTAASAFLFLGFSVRAGISNTAQPSKASFVIECLFLVFSQLSILDVWLMRSRDEIVDFLELREHADLQGELFRDTLRSLSFSVETRFVLVARILLLPLSLVLYTVGFAIIPEPSANANNDSSIRMRGVASISLIFVIAIMNIVMILSSSVHQPPWLPQVLLFGVSVMLWLPAIYAFGLVSIMGSSSALVESKTFFYAGFGVGHAVAILVLLSMSRWKRIWQYRVGDDYGPDDGPPPPRPFAYMPPRAIAPPAAEQ